MRKLTEQNALSIDLGLSVCFPLEDVTFCIPDERETIDFLKGVVLPCDARELANLTRGWYSKYKEVDNRPSLVNLKSLVYKHNMAGRSVTIKTPRTPGEKHVCEKLPGKTSPAVTTHLPWYQQ